LPRAGLALLSGVAIPRPHWLSTPDDALAYAGPLGRQAQPGHRCQFLRDGAETYPAMLAAIAGARHTVHLETYILADDTVGRIFAGALLERARAGVRVRVLYDAVGSLGLADDYLALLRDGGVAVLAYRPLRLGRSLRRLSRRNHRKILVVDGAVGFTGGLNISLDYATPAIGGKGWRDTHLRVTGPLVADLERMFWEVWHHEGGQPYRRRPADARETVAGPETSWATVVENTFGKRSSIRREYLAAMTAARTSIYIANAYFVPDRGTLKALLRAARRGVDVRLLVPERSDVPIVLAASQHCYRRLLDAGVRIFEWPDVHMHAKTAVVDGAWSVVGSFNLDYMSLRQNLELIVEILDSRFGHIMQREFVRDLAPCSEVELERWKRRGWWRRLASWIAYRFRRWM